MTSRPAFLSAPSMLPLSNTVLLPTCCRLQRFRSTKSVQQAVKRAEPRRMNAALAKGNEDGLAISARIEQLVRVNQRRQPVCVASARVAQVFDVPLPGQTSNLAYENQRLQHEQVGEASALRV